ncbi:molybdopterin biosynthesis protein MoeA [Gluconobacter thailandicus F149-1 = NBRC 100600]|uniref:Molybdopterin molybdenumtransferase n=1 Tax=Gluconobacter thailandicus NBRC 3257 TaxID=1381097 RepID=A0ABQ0ITM7_GLUTH|nr:molybdopterin biosynthesis protein MoeA [Gluconobacter thailandicus]GAC88821.1 molybdopterin biosynthesis MoeA protein [Gluconobacter thailandicus NBRC 3255]GAD25572.1 molybdopterin biosynthesis MoeA protein [Gluconobacter thailandicus NBRC 3257]GAN94384.1 molybdopterin biosynthesis protein MoeA [Gluconobacter thailandicus F149-1 = NBRC 100600]GBR61763.1 molybdopterin biosynthesis protein MoeA [Gluconobacter thailandicus F149-1 = NBRC 100600]
MERKLVELLSVAQAVDLVLGYAGHFGTEQVSLAEASGRILQQTICAERAQPPYDRVMMDGIAYRYGTGPVLGCQGIQRAGVPGQALPEGNACLEVMTGAVLPPGADTVVPVERLVRDGKHIRFEDGYAPEKGQFIHRKGADCVAGHELLAPGLRLNGPALAVLAGNGHATVEVSSIPSIGIIATGDELVEVGASVRDWEIRRSNEYALTGALASRGFTRLERSVVPDDLAETMLALEKQLARHDVLVLSGGVSMGQFDHVPTALMKLGVERVFHKVAQRPGKPLWFGVGPEGQRVFGLPGNPVSATCCATRYVIPMLLAAQGVERPETYSVELTVDAARVATLTRYLPVRVTHDGSGRALATPYPMPTSGDFSFLAATDGFVELAPGEGAAPAGSHAVFHGW